LLSYFFTCGNVVGLAKNHCVKEQQEWT